MNNTIVSKHHWVARAINELLDTNTILTEINIGMLRLVGSEMTAKFITLRIRPELQEEINGKLQRHHADAAVEIFSSLVGGAGASTRIGGNCMVIFLTRANKSPYRTL